MVTLNFELHLYKGQTGVTGATGATGATGLVQQVQQVQQELQELLAESVIITQTIMVTFTFKLHLYKVQAGVFAAALDSQKSQKSQESQESQEFKSVIKSYM